jgi:hypothetical protein
MIRPSQPLSERIRGELMEMDRIVQRALRSWPKAQKGLRGQEAYIDSVALNLQAFYAGIERLFELIARQVDHTLPMGETWHRDLLKQMGKEIPGIRPAVIDNESIFDLDDFRRFRHLVQNIYTFNLVPEKMMNLIQKIPELWARLRAELFAFSEFLDVLHLSGRKNKRK